MGLSAIWQRGKVAQVDYIDTEASIEDWMVALGVVSETLNAGGRFRYDFGQTLDEQSREELMGLFSAAALARVDATELEPGVYEFFINPDRPVM